MSKTELSKAYNAAEIEDKIYEKWEKSGYFNPDKLPGDRPDAFVISMPPPNVTGVLHLGHAFENALMDIEIRYQRLLGKRALIVPGTDHAAVATQARVEDDLKKQGIANPRQELGRDKLLEKIRDFAESHKKIMIGQIKKMGTSCDWSRLAYTFDGPRSEAVNELFRRMFVDGLIYRGYRVINWSVKGQSTCSDDELVYVDQPAKIWYFKYSHDFPIPIATTRPETKLGDTAVAVNPDDDRYKQYIGQKFTVDVGAAKPLIITIIGDAAVDPKYGTGAVGVTPAHSAIDYEMYQNNKDIGIIPVIGPDGKMLTAAGPAYAGLPVLEAREKFVQWLKDQGLYIKEEESTHNVGTSDRFGDVVEALPMEQWFVDVNKKIPERGKTLKALMREAVTVGHEEDANKIIKITPEHFHDIYLHWIDNLRDWCISRQIWWGHRIPIWYCDDCGHYFYSSDVPSDCPKCNSKKLHQDEDTLDTWFSSAAWTFSTLGWPTETDDLLKYHPTTWMQMGYEILFFWMARMILMTTYALDDIPFKDVYIHGILRAKDGRKFSKSLGNGLDPLDIIAKYGTDALRLSLIKGVTAGNDSRFFEEKIEGARNFVNKLWNISRYILQSVENPRLIENEPAAKSLSDDWILSRLDATIISVTAELDKYNFSSASELLHEFTWSDFADWYLEIAKIEGGKDDILLFVLQSILKLWNPFCPFITEYLYNELGAPEMLIVAAWPKKFAIDPDAGADFQITKDIITALRNLRSENKIEPAKLVTVSLIAGDKAELIKKEQEIIKKLARVESLNVLASGTKPDGYVGTVAGGVEIYLDLSGLVDTEAEKKRLAKETAEIEKYLTGLESKLANQEFVANAPEAVVAKEQEKLSAAREKLDKLREQLNSL